MLDVTANGMSVPALEESAFVATGIMFTNNLSKAERIKRL